MMMMIVDEIGLWWRKKKNSNQFELNNCLTCIKYVFFFLNRQYDQLLSLILHIHK